VVLVVQVKQALLVVLVELAQVELVV